MSKIIFQDKHQATLTPGEYEITVTSTLGIDGKDYQFTSDQLVEGTKQAYQFSVAGDRFILAPTQIHSVFPPQGNLGEHSNVMPHIILYRSTLPWERDASIVNNKVPWLALLLFDEDEAPNIQTMAFDKLLVEGGPSFPEQELERGQQGTDELNVIDVSKSLLEKILPEYNELSMLTHVRKDSAGVGEGAELAVVVCNRLPKPQGKSVVHLVSLEGRMKKSGFNYLGVSDPLAEIRLISLHSWSFSCITPDFGFRSLLLGLDQGAFRLPENTNTDTTNIEIERNLARGAKLLPYKLRNGDRSYAWYQGPLSPGARTTNIDQAYFTLPVRSADELILYNAEFGLFDVSYAAAWELGRSMILRDADMALKLYRWKRAYARSLKQEWEDIGYLPDVKIRAEVVSLPEEVESWFKELQHLENIPFSNLVCDEALLPVESIRFFHLDALWLDCLLDGAYSVGRISEHDVAEEYSLAENLTLAPNPNIKDYILEESPSLTKNQNISGVLLRSEVVSGWPALEFIAYNDTANTTLTLLRKVRLGENVLLCLFDGEINSLDIQQKAEALHYGLDSGVDSNFTKGLRQLSTTVTNPVKLNAIPMREDSTTPTWSRVINIKMLAAEIKSKTGETNFTSADFSLQMVEGVERVSFSIAPAAGAGV